MTRTPEPTPEQTTEPRRSRAFWRRPGSVFGNRDYLILLTGQTISGTGASMGMFVFPLVALQITGSTVQAGLVGTAAGLAQWLLGLPAGALVDRWHRRKVMLASEGTGSVAFGSLVVAQAAAPIAPIAGGWLLAHEGHYVAMYGFVALLVVAAIIVTVSKAVREVPMASEWASLAPVENDGAMTLADAS